MQFFINICASVTKKNISAYSHIIDKFFSKFQGRGIKITCINSIRVAKPIIFFDIRSVVTPQATASSATVFFQFNLSEPVLLLL